MTLKRTWNPHKRLKQVRNWLHEASQKQQAELTRWERTVRFAYDLCRHGARQLRRDRAPQMGAALAFRTLFSLLPVLVVATVVIRAVRGIDAFLDLVDEVIVTLQLDDVTMSFGATGETTSFGQWLRELIGSVEQINLAAIGWIGLGVLIYAAISLVVTIENSFNSIYSAPQGRKWWQRMLTYWFVLTVGPVVIGLTIFMADRFDSWVVSTGVWQWIIDFLGIIASLAITTGFMFALYALVPNTEVAWRPALIGAVVAAVLIQAGKGSLDAYMTNAVSIRQLYGSLGLVPLFMFWTYLMWLVVLFGLEVAATLQKLAGRRIQELEEQKPSGGLVDPAFVLIITQLISERFGTGESTSARWLAENAGLRERTVCIILERLAEKALVHRLEGESMTVSLARPPEQIDAGEVMEIGFALADEAGLDRGRGMLKKLREVQRRLMEGTTMASLPRTSRAS